MPPEAPSCRVVPGYLARRGFDLGGGWFEDRLRSLVGAGRGEEAINTLMLVTDASTPWDIAASLGSEIERSYWRRLDRVFPKRSRSEWERAIGSLLRHGNIATALRSAEWAGDTIGPETISLALEGLLAAQPEEVQRCARDPAWSFTLQQLMDRLEAAPDVETQVRIAPCERRAHFTRFRADRSNRPLRRLSSAFAASPATFIDLVKSMYRPRGVPPPLHHDEQVVRAAGAAHRVLEAWTGYPGEGLPGSGGLPPPIRLGASGAARPRWCPTGRDWR